MNLKQYQVLINKTWKKDTPEKEFEHVALALIEEVGELSGWYKKHVSYGRPKEGEIQTGIKEEIGDLLYYIVKAYELNEGKELPVEEHKFLCKASTKTLLFNCSFVVNRLLRKKLFFKRARNRSYIRILFYILQTIIKKEGYTLECIMSSNIKKLSVRHGDKFKDEQGSPSNRNKEQENKAVNE